MAEDTIARKVKAICLTCHYELEELAFSCPSCGEMKFSFDKRTVEKMRKNRREVRAKELEKYQAREDVSIHMVDKGVFSLNLEQLAKDDAIVVLDKQGRFNLLLPEENED